MVAPANDLIANATAVEITTDGGTYTSPGVSLADAAGWETGEFNPTQYTIGNKSVWWKYVPVSSGTATIDTELSTGQLTDTELAVYTGPAADVAQLTKVAQDSDSGVNNTSLVTLAVTAGTTYYVQVGMYQGAHGATDLAVLRVAGPSTVPLVAEEDDPVDLLAARVGVEFKTLRGGLPETIRDTLGATLVQGDNVTITVDDTANTVTIAASGTTDPEVVRDTIAAALVAGSNVTITPNDAGDSITITAANTTDPEVVRDTMGTALVAGSNVTITPSDEGDTITIAAAGGGGGATTLAALSDVDDTVPTTGQALVWDGDSWHPTTLTSDGGPEVGAWQNNLQTNFVYPAPVEVDKQAAPIVWTNGRTTTPLIELTVTEAMLVTNTGDDLGHETGIVIFTSTIVPTISGAGTPFMEVSVLRAATNIETVYSANQVGTPGTANWRSAASFYVPHVKVGDKIRLRFWTTGNNAPNFRTDWWAHRSVVSKLGHKVDAGRIGLFRDIVRTGSVGTYAPTTVLTSGPTAWTATNAEATREQWLDNGILIGQNQAPGQVRTLLADPAVDGKGIVTTGDGVTGTSNLTITSFQNVAHIHGMPNLFVQLRADRLWVPIPPT